MNAPGASETDEIKSEIERTRAEMSNTLGEIQERLSPDHLIQQAKDTVSEAATGKVRNIMHSASETAQMVAEETQYAGRNVASYVRSHPVQMALLAGGITWWMLRNADRSYEWEGASEGWDSDRQMYDEGQDSLSDRVGEYATSAKDTVSDYASSARQTVGEYADSARASARRASDRAYDAATSARDAARRGWQRTSTSVDDWVHEYPFAAGAIAVAVGAAIGLSAPGTDLEDRTMGTTRDEVWARTSRAAREMKDNVTQKVQDVAESVADVAGAATTPTTRTAGTTGTTATTETGSTPTTGRL
jgi:ElaB/YqjD/DUF883 family membrane-anchored ribosome-binding protein